MVILDIDNPVVQRVIALEKRHESLLLTFEQCVDVGKKFSILELINETGEELSRLKMSILRCDGRMIV